MKPNGLESPLLTCVLSFDSKFTLQVQILIKREQPLPPRAKEGRLGALSKNAAAVGGVTDGRSGASALCSTRGPGEHLMGQPGPRSPCRGGAAGRDGPRAKCPWAARSGSTGSKGGRGRRREALRGRSRAGGIPDSEPGKHRLASQPRAPSNVCRVTSSKGNAQSNSVTHLRMCSG